MAIVSKNGEQGYASIVDAVKSEAAGYAPADKISRKLARWNHTAAGALIGMKVSVMAKQALDPIVAAACDEGGFNHLANGLRRK